MMETLLDCEVKLRRLKIGTTDVFLEDTRPGAGKMTISDTYGHNYSCFWGAMGKDCDLANFICHIDSAYFAGNLLSKKKSKQMSVAATFRQLRKYIKDEIGLKWYQHMDFQRDMREKIRDFEQECQDMPSEEFFVNQFFSFINYRLNYWMIEDDRESKRIEKEFREISEPWYFIEKEFTAEYKWVIEFHGKLKAALQAPKK